MKASGSLRLLWGLLWGLLLLLLACQSTPQPGERQASPRAPQPASPEPAAGLSSRAYAGRATTRGGVISYLHLPTAAGLEQDLPRLKLLLGVERLRFYLPLAAAASQWPRLTRLSRLAARAGFGSELVLTELDRAAGPLNADWGVRAQTLQLAAIALEVPASAAGQQRFEALYAQLGPRAGQTPGWQDAQGRFRPIAREILFSRPEQLERLQPRLPAPDRWLYRFDAPLEQMHTLIRRIDSRLGTGAWQLALAASGSPNQAGDEYAQTWLYRFAFYFSRKYGLDPAAVSLHDTPLPDSRNLLPGLLRADGTARPAYWLTQVYYQVHRIDLDEPKLTAALYAPPAPPRQRPEQAEAFARQFLQALYKLRPDEDGLAYLDERDSAAFYDYVRLRSEESLINSHFARLEALELQREGPPARHHWRATLHFASALGNFSFDQRLGLARGSGGWRVASLEEARLRPDYRRLATGPAPPLALTTTIDPRLEVGLQLRRLAPSQPPQLHFEVRNRGQRPLDVQPIALTGDADGRIYMPSLVETVLAHQLAPGEVFAGTIQLPPQPQAWRLKMAAVPAEPSTPRSLVVSGRVSAGRLELDVSNPLIERLLLPVIRVRLRAPGAHADAYELPYVLPQALLPLERKHYSLPLPQDLQRAEVSAIGTSYPIVDLEINLDDAWRSKLLGHWSQALNKYREIQRRFETQLSPERRQRLYYELIWLAFRLHQPQAARADLARLESLPQLPAAAVAQSEYALAEMLLADHQLSEAAELARLGLGHQPQHLPLLRLMAYVLLQQHDLPAALTAYRRLLAHHPDDRQALETISSLYQRQGDWARALPPLLRLQQLQPQTGRLPTLASLHQRLGDFAAALAAYRRYLTAGGSRPVTAEIAWLYARLNQPREALRWYRQALNEPGSIVRWLDTAYLEQRYGSREAALKDFSHYLGHCEACRSQAYADAGYLAKSLGQVTRAIDFYARHLALTGASDSRRALGGLYQQQGQRARALQTLRPLAQACRRDCRELWLNLAYLAGQSRNWAEALSWYRRLGPLTSLPPALAYDAAFVALQAGETRAAESLLTGGRLSGARRRALNRELGAHYRRTGRPLQALALLETAYRRDRDEALLEDLLAAALEAGQPRQILALVAPLAQRPPALSPTGHYLLGKWAYATGDYVTATLQLQRAIATAPLQGETYRLLAAAYRALGQTDCAIGWLERADHRLAGRPVPVLPPGCR